MKRSPTIVTRIILIGFLLAGISACSASRAEPTEEIPLIEDFSPIVSATGVVTPEEWSRLSISIAGVVDKVMVEKGDHVEKDQLLVSLKGSEDLRALVTAARLELISAEQALDSLHEHADIAKANSLKEVSEYSRTVRDAKYNLDNYTVPTNMQGLTALEAVELMRERLDQAREAFEPYKFKSEQNPTRRDLKQKLDWAQSDYNEAVRWLTLEFEMAESEARLNKALKDYEVLKDGPDPDELELAEARLENAKANLASAESKLDDLEIRALFTGTVSEIYVRAGEWVSPGQPILLLGDLEHLRVETTDLNEIDVARVQVGDTVNLTFDALPEVVVDGKVRLIAPKAAEGTGVNYTVVIDLSETPESLRWGMTVFVDIEVKK